jgi:hypothetical protein
MGITLVVLNTGWLLPLLTIVAVVYVPYYVIRAMFLGVSRQPSYAEAHQAALVRANRPRALTVKEWKDRKRTELAAKPTSTRLVELGSSMSTSVIALAIFGVVALFATTSVFDRGFENIGSLELAPIAWSAVVAAVGSAAMLFFGKLWEREGEATFRRRVVMLGAGAGLGAFAYALASFLMLPTLSIDQGLARETSFALPPALYSADGSPYLAALMAHFAVLFAGLRWWKVSDPLRRRRFSLWATAVAVVAEWGLHQVLPIPQPFGMIAVGMLAASVQFAAPWENPKQRLQYLNRDATQIA